MADIQIPLTTRLPIHLHCAAGMVAELEGRSLNNLIQHALTEYVRSRLADLPEEIRASLTPAWRQ